VPSDVPIGKLLSHRHLPAEGIGSFILFWPALHSALMARVPIASLRRLMKLHNSVVYQDVSLIQITSEPEPSRKPATWRSFSDALPTPSICLADSSFMELGTLCRSRGPTSHPSSRVALELPVLSHIHYLLPRRAIGSSFRRLSTFPH
jgi:hypothetical protein